MVGGLRIPLIVSFFSIFYARSKIKLNFSLLCYISIITNKLDVNIQKMLFIKVNKYKIMKNCHLGTYYC